MRKLALPFAFALATFVLLCWLAAWQLERLAWKEGLLARIRERATAPPAPLPPPADWAALSPDAYDYRHVIARGSFDHASEALVFRGSGDGKPGAAGPGYLVLTPLHLAGGGTLIVNRGFVPLAKKNPADRAAGQVAGEVQTTGLLRPPEPRNSFTPIDVPAAGEWYTRDPALIAAHFALADAAPFTLDADAAPAPPGGLPQGGATVLDVPNNHLSYAVTWFGLALTLLGVFGVFAAGVVRRSSGS